MEHKIERILVANSGMAAVKCMRSLRSWAYHSTQQVALHLTAMCTPDDLTANAEHVRLADDYVMVEGGEARCNYSNVNLQNQMLVVRISISFLNEALSSLSLRSFNCCFTPI